MNDETLFARTEEIIVTIEKQDGARLFFKWSGVPMRCYWACNGADSSDLPVEIALRSIGVPWKLQASGVKHASGKWGGSCQMLDVFPADYVARQE